MSRLLKITMHEAIELVMEGKQIYMMFPVDRYTSIDELNKAKGFYHMAETESEAMPDPEDSEETDDSAQADADEPEPAAAPDKKKRSKDLADAVIKLHKTGMKNKDIAIELGCSACHVSSIIKKHKESELDPAYADHFEQDVFRLYHVGNGPEAIARALDCELAAVTTLLKRNNIKC